MRSISLCVVVGLTAACFIALLAPLSAQAQTFTDLYNFKGSSDGKFPWAGVYQDAKGNLYGTAFQGGPSNFGVVFKVDTKNKETVLYSFTGSNDGGFPFSPLIQDGKGNLYGTTAYGGQLNQGTVFEVDAKGTETVLYNFAGGATDGCHPYGGLLRDKAGNFYGTTELCGASGYGTVYKVSKSGTETVLHSFAGEPSDGEGPMYTTLLMDAKGNLYGITEKGGTSGDGLVYELSKKGTETVLYNFAGGTTDGCFPLGTPAMDKTGNIYGTAGSCGANDDGIVWKLSKQGTETVLHNFGGQPSDGAYPYAGVVMDAKGNLYGDTLRGGANDYGAVYKLSKNGKQTVLHSFSYNSDGGNPVGDLLRNAKGTLYATNEDGGVDGNGTVWKLTP
jgi:uncharacterized repeat protein (TIGR03803 family)